MRASRNKKRHDKGGRGSQQLRIIGGQWRGRKLAFADLPGLRPTADRIRETLFNWLTFEVPGARCLDLFSGSGALGLEALSREAAHVSFVDQQAAVTRQLESLLQELHCSAGQVIQQNALQLLRQPPQADPFDLVFLDPPFRQGLLAPCCERLENNGWLSARAWIYIEYERELTDFQVPANWRLHRQKQAGQVCYSLYQREAPLYSDHT